MSETIQTYYDRIGSSYDEDRFGNSTYGQYIHRQERAFLDRWLPANPSQPVLDMGCGTGRFMERATDGVDFSEGMLSVARQKWPQKRLHVANITQTKLESTSFATVFSLHVLMHLDAATTHAFFAEAHRLLRPGGRLIVDFPSQDRRAIRRRSVGADHWHGSNAHTTESLLALEKDRWKLVHQEGILFFPVHRISRGLRPSLCELDRVLCRSVLKKYASYLIIVLEKL